MEEIRVARGFILSVGEKVETTFAVLLVSKRCARLILRKSLRGKWRRPFACIVPSCVEKNVKIKIVGFCPQTGFHLAYKPRKR